MFKKIKMFFIIAETPIHAGSGSELGIVDLPIQRERYTDFPKIEASGLKGCIREAFENTDKKNYVPLIFGPEEGEAYASAISFTDARILLFPVKSLKGIFAWITCPMVLERFKKDLELAGITNFNFSNFINLQNTLPQQTNLAIESRIVLEEFTFEVKEEQITSGIANWLADKIFPNNNSYNYWKEKLRKDLVILPDDDFKQFVKTSTEVITRTRIDDTTGTVKPGALWTEEYLPQDTILYSLAMFTGPRKKDSQKMIFKADTPEEKVEEKEDTPEKAAERVAEFFEKWIPKVIQIGGNATIGKGLVRINFLKESKNERGK